MDIANVLDAESASYKIQFSFFAVEEIDKHVVKLFVPFLGEKLIKYVLSFFTAEFMNHDLTAFFLSIHRRRSLRSVLLRMLDKCKQI